MPFPENSQKPASRQGWNVVLAIIGVLVVSSTLTLTRVEHPARLQPTSENPTPFGYTWSLVLFILPTAVLIGWFLRHPECRLPRAAFWRTILVLVPVGFVLDVLFGNVFFRFQNHESTVGIGIPAVGGPIPVEEFAFYLFGFVIVLLTYIWGDEYWLLAYNVPDYSAAARGVSRLVRFHAASVLVGIVLFAVAVVYKKLISPTPEGFPWYFTYLLVAVIVPSAGFFGTAKPFINWRAFSFTFFFILLISLLWEVTLALPYGWWDYEPAAMLGLTIGAWWNLPIEAVCVWFAVTFTTVITYEVIKIWRALGKGAVEAFFG